MGLGAEPQAVFPAAEVMPIALSEEGFARLVARVDATFARNGDGTMRADVGPGLYGPSLFYQATGSFHIFRLCNQWVADLLDAAGLPTAPALSTMPQGLLQDLRWRSGLAVLPRNEAQR